ncbi:septal ring lytic transglycosylase RlpA family protein [uncultured Hyphomonas sp.]|uniref:septal ring lytic transglycosylase RlpA family protein n=1 Tax=uncultured Hyphomonas sp. TaxID=225298 RepID=UPI002AABBA94|nr:septal ring lytic transglycosylase RlpA family protein [uncultured Hyphomonas sp.]
MKTVSSASKSLHFPSLVITGAIALAIAVPAHAGKRDPAPIVYATGTSSYPEGKPQYIEPSRAPDAKQKKQARIQFRYPGSVSPPPSAGVTAEQGTRYPEPAEREYASIDAPAQKYSSVSGASPNSFDARAAAARIEAQRSVSAVESEPLSSLQPVTPPAATPAPAVAPTNQFQTAARTLTPAASYAVSGEPVPVFDETSVTIVYGAEFNGLPTANGETFDPNAMTAAHPTLPLPSLIQVVNTQTGKEVVLRVNDRGPFEDGASLQVSPRAAGELGMNGAGKATLRVRYLGAAPAAATPSSPAPQLTADVKSDVADYMAPVAYTPAPVQKVSQAEPTYTYNSVPEATPAGDFFVQIGSFTDISNAQSLSNQVQASLPVTIVPARVNGADYFRVRVGPLLNRSEAERAQNDLSYAGIASGRIVVGE